MRWWTVDQQFSSPAWLGSICTEADVPRVKTREKHHASASCKPCRHAPAGDRQRMRKAWSNVAYEQILPFRDLAATLFVVQLLGRNPQSRLPISTSALRSNLHTCTMRESFRLSLDDFFGHAVLPYIEDAEHRQEYFSRCTVSLVMGEWILLKWCAG
jgi:hypothetical protein